MGDEYKIRIEKLKDHPGFNILAPGKKLEGIDGISVLFRVRELAEDVFPNKIGIGCLEYTSFYLDRPENQIIRAGLECIKRLHNNYSECYDTQSRKAFGAMKD